MPVLHRSAESMVELRSPAKRCVVIVGADEAMRDAVGLWLERDGFSVSRAIDGPDAANQLASRGADLLITDRIYPAWDGLGTIQDVKQRHPQTKIMVIGRPGHLRDPFAGLAGVAGADGVVAWPSSRLHLLAAVHRLAGRD